MKVSIIGTAGRKEDGERMSAGLYDKMFEKVKGVIAEETGKIDRLDLISGGAGWSDHLAIRLFLQCPEKYMDKVGLTLFLPAEFDAEANKYEGEHWKSAGSISNYYHSLFSKKVGYNTLEQISRAIRAGATIKVFNGFYARNKEVGKTDLLIAFTWGRDGVKDGGTKNTWDGSKAPKKVHISLWELI